MCRASVLEGENAELRARLAASEHMNERLRSRLQSTVAAFHRMLAQEKEKSEGKDSELAGIKTHSLQLQGFLLLILPLVMVIYTQERNSESNFENVFTLSLSLSLARSLALSLSISLSLSRHPYIAGKLEARSVEAKTLRQQVALLHKWCSSSSAHILKSTPTGFIQRTC